MNRLEHKDAFIKTLAQYLSGNQVVKSIELEMGKPHAKEWAELRNASGIFGYLTVAETVAELKKLLC